MVSAASYFGTRESDAASLPSLNSFLLSAEEELKSSWSDYKQLVPESEESRMQFIAASFKGLIGVKMQPVVEVATSTASAATTSFYARYTAQYPDFLLNATGSELCNVEASPTKAYSKAQDRLTFRAFSLDEISPDALFAYDAAIALARALHFLIYESRYKSLLQHNSDLSPTMIQEAFRENVSFAGVTGHVAFDSETSRSADLTVEVFNFHPDLYLSSINRTSELRQSDYELGFVSVGILHSEKGFSACNSSSPTVSGRNCHVFVYNSEDNGVVSDRPALVTLSMSLLASRCLLAAAVLGIVIVAGHSYLMWFYEHSRLVRVTQPFLSSLILIGCVFSFGSVMHSSIRHIETLSDGFCATGTWLQDLAISFILAPLFVKKLRINLILSARKNVATDKSQFSISNRQGNVLAISMIVGAIFFRLFSDHVICEKHTFEYTILRNDQFKHTQEASCPDFGTCRHASSSYWTEMYSGLLLLLGCIACCYHNRSDIVVEEADICLRGINIRAKGFCLVLLCWEA